MKKRIFSLVLVIAMMLPVFNIIAIAANEPTITSHQNGKTYAADEFYIKWKSVDGAKRYRLAVKSMDDGSYAADIYWDDNLTKTKYECDEDDIKPGHRYKIWVGACGNSHDDVISQYSIEVIAKAAVCDHDDYEDYYDYSKYEQISGDNTNHNAVHYYERVCEDCDETIKSNIKGNIEKEKHSFSGDKCTKCSYVKVDDVCKHSKTTTKAVDHEYDEYDGQKHYVTTYHDKICSDCKETVESGIKGSTIKEAHSFSGNKCTKCEYEIVEEVVNPKPEATVAPTVAANTDSFEETVCYHKNTKKVHSGTERWQIPGDEQYHNKIECYYEKCTDCGIMTKTDVKDDPEKESHSFSNNQCTKCKYEKEDEKAPEIYSLECLEGYSIDVSKTNEINIKATVSDNAKSVEFFLSGIGSIGNVRCRNGYATMSLDTSSIYTGVNSVSAVAYDSQGNASEYAEVYFEIIKEDSSITGSFSPTPQQGEIDVVVNGSYINFDVPPQIINDRTMVPLRAIFEALGCDVKWNGEEQKVIARNADRYIEIVIGEPTMVVQSLNGYGPSGWTYLDSPAVIIDGRTLVPVRAVAEAFMCEVEWDEATKTVSIY